MKSIIDYHNGIFTCTTYGDASIEGVHELLDILLSHKQWKPGSTWLINHQNLNADTLNKEYILEIAQLFIKRHNQIGAGKCAVVVANKLQYGLSRMIISFVGDKWTGEVNLCHSLDEADDWLNSQQ